MESVSSSTILVVVLLLVLLVAAAALLRCGPPAIAEAFIAERVAQTDRQALFGTLGASTVGAVASELIERNAPRFVPPRQ